VGWNAPRGRLPYATYCWRMTPRAQQPHPPQLQKNKKQQQKHEYYYCCCRNMALYSFHFKMGWNTPRGRLPYVMYCWRMTPRSLQYKSQNPPKPKCLLTRMHRRHLHHKPQCLIPLLTGSHSPHLRLGHTAPTMTAAECSGNGSLLPASPTSSRWPARRRSSMPTEPEPW